MPIKALLLPSSTGQQSSGSLSRKQDYLQEERIDPRTKARIYVKKKPILLNMPSFGSSWLSDKVVDFLKSIGVKARRISLRFTLQKLLESDPKLKAKIENAFKSGEKILIEGKVKQYVIGQLQKLVIGRNGEKKGNYDLVFLDGFVDSNASLFSLVQEAFKDVGRRIDGVIRLVGDNNLSQQAQTKMKEIMRKYRRICENRYNREKPCHSVYNTKLAGFKPNQDAKCDDCNGNLMQMPDDKDPVLLSKRIEMQEAEEEQISNFAEQNGIHTHYMPITKPLSNEPGTVETKLINSFLSPVNMVESFLEILKRENYIDRDKASKIGQFRNWFNAQKSKPQQKGILSFFGLNSNKKKVA